MLTSNRTGTKFTPSSGGAFQEFYDSMKFEWEESKLQSKANYRIFLENIRKFRSGTFLPTAEIRTWIQQYRRQISDAIRTGVKKRRPSTATEITMPGFVLRSVIVATVVLVPLYRIDKELHPVYVNQGFDVPAPTKDTEGRTRVRGANEPGALFEEVPVEKELYSLIMTPMVNEERRASIRDRDIHGKTPVEVAYTFIKGLKLSLLKPAVSNWHAESVALNRIILGTQAIGKGERDKAKIVPEIDEMRFATYYRNLAPIHLAGTLLDLAFMHWPANTKPPILLDPAIREMKRTQTMYNQYIYLEALLHKPDEHIPPYYIPVVLGKIDGVWKVIHFSRESRISKGVITFIPNEQVDYTPYYIRRMTPETRKVMFTLFQSNVSVWVDLLQKEGVKNYTNRGGTDPMLDYNIVMKNANVVGLVPYQQVVLELP